MIWLLYILLFLLALICLVLLLDVGVDVRYGQREAAVRISVFGIRVFKIPLELEPPPPALADKSKKAPKKQKETTKKPDKGKTITGIFGSLNEILTVAKRTMRTVYRKTVKKIRVNKLKIHLAVATDDAVKTTMLLGTLSGLINSVCATLSYIVTLKDCDVNIVPDYRSDEFGIDIHVIVRFWVFRLVLTAVALYPIYKEIKERTKQNEHTSDQ